MMSKKIRMEYECDDCKRLFKTQQSLRAHIWSHLKIQCLCCVCEKPFMSKQNVLNHRKNVHHYHGKWIPKWRCGICSIITNEKQIHSHVTNCQKRNKNNMQCPSRTNAEFIQEIEATAPIDNANIDGEQNKFAFTMAAIIFVIGVALLVSLFLFTFVN